MRIIFCITGASGVIYAQRCLEFLKDKAEIHLIISNAAKIVMEKELKKTTCDFESLVHKTYDVNDIQAPLASSSLHFDAVLIVPCSMKTLGMIANGIASNLITRTSDVALKEGRKLILMPREAPYSLIHLENMIKIKRAGGVVLPASPGFYHKPENISDLVNFMVGKVCQQLGIKQDFIKYE
ncbi:MAG: UbiX family flavin prenyltransferase [Candidatus Lokiarchaeota archaeon]|nr:UbiX family flavin prenyltransferase [Candidatus Lokiarchaeota archaeon]